MTVMVMFPLPSVVKEEISDDDARLPFVNGRVVCWVRHTHTHTQRKSSSASSGMVKSSSSLQLVSNDTCQSDFGGSDLVSIATPTSVAPPPIERTGGIGDSRPPSFQ